MALSLLDTAMIYVCAMRSLAKAKGANSVDRSAARAKAREHGADTATLAEAEKALRKSKYIVSGFSKSDLVVTELGWRVACPAGLGRAKKAGR